MFGKFIVTHNNNVLLNDEKWISIPWSRFSMYVVIMIYLVFLHFNSCHFDGFFDRIYSDDTDLEKWSNS